MNLLRILTISAMTLSMVGCCGFGRCCVIDPCDACSNGPVIGGGVLRFFAMPNSSSCYASPGGCGSAGCDSCGIGGFPVEPSCGCGQCGRPPRRPRLPKLLARRRCHRCLFGQPCGCGNVYDGGMMDGGCSSGNCGGTISTYGAPSTCGCGQSHPYTPSTVSPIPTPNSIPESNSKPAPMPPTSQPNDEDSLSPSHGTTQRVAPSMPAHTVSYEEFQRLPGTIISGPGATMNTAPSASLAAAPRTSVAPPKMMPRPAIAVQQPSVTAQNQQAVWVPAKPN